MQTTHSSWRMADIGTWFQAEYVTDPYYRDLFVRLLDIQQAGKPLTSYVIAQGLQQAGRQFNQAVRDLGGLILDCTGQRVHLRYYAADVYQEHRRQHAAVDIAGVADDMMATDNPDDVLSQLPEIASKYAPDPIHRTHDNAAVIQEMLDELEGKKPKAGFRFGIQAIDEVIGSIPPMALVTVGARTPSRIKSDGREQQVAHIAASLKALATKSGVPVLTATQLNKEGQETPRLSSIRESEAIANYSNIVLFLSPENMVREETTLDVNIAKNRDGHTNLVTAHWDKPIYRIRDHDAHDLPNYDPALASLP